MEDLLVIIFAVICLYFAWWHGHKSIWGTLHYKNKIPSPDNMNLIDSGFLGFINIDVAQHNKREGGWSVNIYLDEHGILFSSVRFFRYFMPSIYLKWLDIKSIEENVPQGYLKQKRTKFNVIGSNDGAILVPPSVYNEGIKPFLENNNIAIGSNNSLNLDASP